MRTRFAVPNVLVTLTLFLCSVCWLFTGTTVEHGNVAFDVSPDGETLGFSDAEGDLWLPKFDAALVGSCLAGKLLST